MAITNRRGGGSHSAGSHSKNNTSPARRELNNYDDYYEDEAYGAYSDANSAAAQSSRRGRESADFAGGTSSATQHTRRGRARTEADYDAAASRAPAGGKKKKTSPKLLKLLLPLLLVALCAFGAIKILKVFKNRTTEEPAEVPVEATPEPVDYREYRLDLPVSGIQVVDYTISCIAEDIRSGFDSKYDGSEPALLETSYVMGSAENGMFNFVLTVSSNGELEHRTYTISDEGGLLTPAQALGESYAEYVSDYLNITKYTEGSSINKNGVILLYNDITQAVAATEDNFPLYLLSDDGGAEFLVPASSIAADAQLLPEGSFENNELPYEQRPAVIAAGVRAMAEAGDPLYNIGDDEEADNAAADTAAGTADTVTDVAADAADAAAPADSSAAEAAAGTVAEASPEATAEGTAADTADSAEAAAETTAPTDTVTAEISSVEPEPRLTALAEETGSIDFCVPAEAVKGNFFSRRRLYPERPMVAVTYDDGPLAETSNAILDTLEEYGVVATFYEIGSRVEKAPEVLLRELQLGCEVGAHTYHHFKLGEMTEAEMLNERQIYKDVFTRAIGFSPETVRPPEGDAMGFTLALFDEPLIGWSVDTEDWLNKDPSKIMYNIKSFETYYGRDLDGQIILMHSIYETTVEATKEVIPYLLEEGYQLVTVSELLEYYYCEPQPLAGHYYYQFDYLFRGTRGVPHEQ